jgi:hypothetical protein
MIAIEKEIVQMNKISENKKKKDNKDKSEKRYYNNQESQKHKEEMYLRLF